MHRKLLNNLSLLLYLLVLVFSFLLKDLLKPFQEKNIKEIKKPNYEKGIFKDVFGKNLFLSDFHVNFPLAQIKDATEVYVIDYRPDCIIKKDKFEVFLRPCNQSFRVEENKSVYLNFKEDGRLCFSSEKTFFKMKIKQLDLENVRVLLEIDLKKLQIDYSGEVIKEAFVVFLKEKQKEKSLYKEEFACFVNCKWWGPDQFLKIYDEKDKKSQKHRIEIDSDIFYVKEGDLLIFKDNKWQLVQDGQRTLDYYLIRIKTIDLNLMEIEGWEEKSDQKYVFMVSPYNNQINKASIEISSAIKRANNCISCFLDSQRTILKQKDVLVKKDGRWRLLKKNINIDEIKNEPIFYFHEVEEKGATQYLVGYIFNPMRTSFQKVKTPLVSFSKYERLQKRKIK